MNERTMEKRNEDPQIGVDDEGEWDDMPKFERLCFALAFLLFVLGVLAWGGCL